MLEKTVEKCCISMNGRSSRLVVQLHCKYGEWAAGQPGGPRVWGWRLGRPSEILSACPGVRKTHNLSFQDCESLQAVFDPASCPHVLQAPAK